MIWPIVIISLGLASAQVVREYVSPEHLESLRASGQDEEFARLLGVDVSLVRPNDEERTEGSKFNHVSPLGDIVLTPEQERTALNFGRYPSMKWPNNHIPIKISDSDFNDDQKRSIINSLANMNERTGRNSLKIVWANSDTKDYVNIFSGGGCWSYLGKIGGQQGLSLQKDGCLSRGTVQHEFMHAGGFAHEHNRMDRDNSVTVLWDNIRDEWKSQYEKVTSPDYVNLGDYDYDSVMHYPIWSPGNWDKDAFKLPPGIDRNRLGQDDGLSPEDVRKIGLVYN